MGLTKEDMAKHYEAKRRRAEAAAAAQSGGGEARPTLPTGPVCITHPLLPGPVCSQGGFPTVRVTLSGGGGPPGPNSARQ